MESDEPEALKENETKTYKVTLICGSENSKHRKAASCSLPLLLEIVLFFGV